jgi:hypothetical protein
VRVLNGGLEEPSGAVLWTAVSAFHDLQLLPEAAVAGNCEEAQRFLEGSGVEPK